MYLLGKLSFHHMRHVVYCKHLGKGTVSDMAFIYANFTIILSLLAGVGLIVLEVFLPGFGLPGISGIVLLIIGLVMTATGYGTLAALGVLIATIAVVAIAISISLRSAAKGALSKSELFLREEDAFKAAPEDMQALLGKTGTTRSVLRPTGIADFDGVRLDVMTQGDFIDEGVQVVIMHVEGTKIIVRQAEA